MTEPEQKVCPRCGARFSCHAPNACWCAEFPTLTAVQEYSDCLCPTCLGQAVAAERDSPADEAKSASEKSCLGGTGDSPVPDGDSPDGIREQPRPRAIGLSHAGTTPIPVGESPTGAGGSPAPPTFQPRSKAAPSAFTLIELLVTVAVIAVLAALLLPVLSRSKLPAQSAKCGSNLRQFVMAAQMYWDDNNGNTFPYVGATTAAGTYYWFGLLGAGAEETRAFDPSTGPLYPWLGTGVDFCPAFNYSSPQFKLKAKGPTCDYGYNEYLATPPLNTRKLAAPAQLALLADSAQVNTFEAPASIQNPMFEEFYYIDNEANEPNPQPNAQFRHQQRANVVFVDGHLGSEQMAPGSLDPRLPAQWIGWLRPEILHP